MLQWAGLDFRAELDHPTLPSRNPQPSPSQTGGYWPGRSPYYCWLVWDGQRDSKNGLFIHSCSSGPYWERCSSSGALHIWQGGLYRAMDRLTEDMRKRRKEMRQLAEENNWLRSSGRGDKWETPPLVLTVGISVGMTVGDRAVSHVAQGAKREGVPLIMAGINVKQRLPLE